MTECDVRDALKQVGFNKSSGVDGLPYEVYLWMSRMLIPHWTDVFNHWFVQSSIPGQVTKSVITFLKKGGWHILQGLGPITQLNIIGYEQIVCKLLPRIWLEPIRTTLWKEYKFKIICTWFIRSWKQENISLKPYVKSRSLKGREKGFLCMLMTLPGLCLPIWI